MNRRRLASAAAVVAVGLLLGGCGDALSQGMAGTDSDGRAGPDSHCQGPIGPGADRAEPLPADVAVTAAVRCFRSVEPVTGDGEWSFTIHQRATGPEVDALVRALRLPSEPPTDGACAAILLSPGAVDVESSSGPMTVATPKDPCGNPRQQVIDAWQALHWVEVSRTRGKQERPEEAVAAGCDAWKDMLAIGSKDARPGGPGPVLPLTASASTLKVCVYTASYPDGWTPSSNTVVDGLPVSGDQLSAADLAQLTSLLDAAGPADECTQRHTAFALILSGPALTMEPLYVELDGCQRFLAPDGTLRQGSPEIAALLSPDGEPDHSGKPPGPPPVETLTCPDELNGINMGGVPFGQGSTTPPAEQARRSTQQLLDRFPDARLRRVYRDDDRQDFVYEEPDGRRRAYLIFTRTGPRRWMSGGDAQC